MTATSLQQTVPPEGVAVCPLSTVQFTCKAKGPINWTLDFDLFATVRSVRRQWPHLIFVPGTIYAPANRVNDNGNRMVEVFTTISGDTLTSTATIDSVSLEDNGKRISCGSFHHNQSVVVRIEGKLNYNHKTNNYTGHGRRQDFF